MTAKEYLQNKYPQMRNHLWNSNPHIDDDWVANMMEEYATSREQEAFKAGFVIAARDDSFYPDQWREVFKAWKGDTK